MSGPTKRIKVRSEFHTVGLFPGEPSRGKACDQTGCGKYASPHFCQPTADAVHLFFSEGLLLTEAASSGQKFEPMNWQQWTNDRLYGIKVWSAEKARWVRRYKKVTISVPRKNGKTEYLAGLCYLHLCKGEKTEEIVVGAQSMDAAMKVIGKHLRRMVHSPAPQMEGVWWSPADKMYFRDANDSQLRFLTSSANAARGIHPGLAILDEIIGIPMADEMVSLCEDGWGTRPQPIIVTASTASDDLLSYERVRHTWMREVRDNPELEPDALPVIFEADPSDDVWNEQTWWLCNPAVQAGVVSKEMLRHKASVARGNAGLEQKFLREHLNLPISPETAYLPVHAWDQRATNSKVTTHDELRKLLRSTPDVFVGIDLSNINDFTALAVAGQDAVTQEWYTTCYTWIPDTVIRELDKMLSGMISQWLAEGWLRPMPSGQEAVEATTHEMLAILADYDVLEVGYDVHNAGPLHKALEENKYENRHILQGYKLAPAIGLLKKLVLDGGITHGGNPVMRYAVQSAELKVVQNWKLQLLRPDYGESAKRIDPLIATINALQTWWEREHEEPEPGGRFWLDDGPVG